MEKIALLIAYFGPLPRYSSVFFETLKRNPSIDLILISDQQVEAPPKNLKILHTSFEALRDRIQKSFDFPICLDRPYKLCDFKPAYGYIFEAELKGYSFWGHCDLDMVLGDLFKFLPQTVLDNYDKIYEFGHLCLYRNTPQNNRRFMQPGGMDYRTVFSTPIICVFDEVIGMQRKFEVLGVPSYSARDCADISPWQYTFQRVESHLSPDQKKCFNHKKQVFFWENGHVYRAASFNDTIQYDEFNYLHFQKRNPTFVDETTEFADAFFCTREGFIPKKPGSHVTMSEIEKYNGYNWTGQLKTRIAYHSFIFKRRFNKYIFRK